MKRLLPLVCVAALVGGCGSDDNDKSSTPSGGGSESGGSVEVVMKDTQFDPKDVTVKVGQKIEWENYDSFDHNVKADSGATFKSDNFGKGGKFEFTPTAAGKIAYECT